MLVPRHGVLAFDHAAIAVRSIDAALGIYGRLLQGVPSEAVDETAKGFRALTLRYPNGSCLELMEPTGTEGFLQRFLDRKGEGLHHITFIVHDLRASVSEARAAGLRVIDESYEDPHWQEAFIPPGDAFGTVVQLAQTDLDATARSRHWPAGSFLASR